MIEYIYLFLLFKIHFRFRPVLQKERLFATVALFLLFGILTVNFSDREITRNLLHVHRTNH